MISAPLPAQSFCLIRHGETTANAAAIIAGITDVALTPLGQNQARALAKSPLPKDFTLYSSPMSRALQTARLAFPGREIHCHPGLRERDWGVFEGRPLCDQPTREATPDQGESWLSMLARVQSAITQICVTPQPLPVMVCHSGIIRAARVLWTTGESGNRPPNATPILFRKADKTLTEEDL